MVSSANRIILFAILIVFSSLAFSQELNKGQSEQNVASQQLDGHGQYLKLLTQKLALSKTQQSEIKTIQDDIKQRQAAAAAAMASVDMSELSKMNPTTKLYEAKVAKIAEFSAEMAREQVMILSDMRKRIFDVLTKEQQDQFIGLSK